MTENLQDQNVVETSYVKGRKFEELFARFMITDLGWSGYIPREYQKSKINNRGSEVDIIAERKDKKGQQLKEFGWAYLVGCFSLIVIGFFIILEVDEDAGIGLMIAGVLSEVVAIILLERGKRLHTESAWVECKNRKNKTGLADMKKSIDELKAHNESKDKKRRYVAHYFVSASGFTNEALAYAKDENVICYEYKQEKFEIVTYLKTI